MQIPIAAQIACLDYSERAMSGKDYDPKLSEAGFMDLVCALMNRLDQPKSKARLDAMHPAEREAALQLGTAVRNYLEVIEGR